MKNKLRAMWRALYDYVGGFGIFMTVVVLIPMTTMCLANRRWGLALVPPVMGWVMIRYYRAEDKKKEESEARRARARKMVDDALASGHVSCELTREQLQQVREWL